MKNEANHSRERRNDRGQAYAEYVIVMFGAALSMALLVAPFRNAVRAYLIQIYFFVSLPIP